MSKVWFITGTSKGFGRVWAEAALARGDRVAATARDPRTLDELVERHGDDVLALALDVTDKAAVDAEEPPLRVFFGDWPLEAMKGEYGRRIEEWERWNDLPVRAFGGVAA